LLEWQILKVQTLRVISIAVALLLALPVASVLGSVLAGGGETWSHLAATGLARYVGNTLLLLVGVACGVISIGVLCAWIVTVYRFPGAISSSGR
jgi:iron(III) transport system permease protein